MSDAAPRSARRDSVRNRERLVASAREVFAEHSARPNEMVRFGIGRPPGRMDPADYVLRDFSAAERKELPLELEEAADAVELLIRVGLTQLSKPTSKRR